MAPGLGLRSHSARVRPVVSILTRLPLASRLLVLAITSISLIGLFVPSTVAWLSLTPSAVSLANLRPLSSYPFVHRGLFHLLFNLAALIPLLDRFETEFGSLTTFILFTGPFSTFTGAIYTLAQLNIFHGNVSILGCSGWVFILLAAEARKTHQTNPSFHLGSVKIPTWTLPLVLILLSHFIIPGSSLLGHTVAAGIGYFWSVPRLRFILLPPDRLLRFIEDKPQLVRRLPGYISLDRKTYGRYGLHPASAAPLPLLPITVLQPSVASASVSASASASASPPSRMQFAPSPHAGPGVKGKGVGVVDSPRQPLVPVTVPAPASIPVTSSPALPSNSASGQATPQRPPATVAAL